MECLYYLRYDFLSKNVVTVVAGNDLKCHLKYPIEHLAELKGNRHPFGVIYTIVSRYYYFLEWQRRQLDHSVIMMERVTDRGAIVYSPDMRDKPVEEPNSDDFNLQDMH